MIPFGINAATTDHGGSIMATQQQAIANGMAFLRAGDGFVCPKCKVWSTLVMNNQNIIMFGKPVAFAGDKFTCGATLLPNQSLVGGDKMSSASQTVSSSHFLPTVPYFDEQFLLKDGNGNPLIEMLYSIKLASGQIAHGTTDATGHTQRHKTDNPEVLEVYLGHIENNNERTK